MTRVEGPILAEQSATAVGAGIGAAVTLLGFLWSTRTNKNDSATQLVTSAMALVKPLQDRIEGLEEEVERLRPLEIEVVKLRVAVEACEAKHSVAQQELAKVKRQLG